jgi:hypothetical protein
MPHILKILSKNKIFIFKNKSNLYKIKKKDICKSYWPLKNLNKHDIIKK